MSYIQSEKELDMYKITGIEHLEAMKDIVVAKDNITGEDIRFEQTFQYGVIRKELYTYEELSKTPTEQEVCEALGEYLEITVFINDENDIKTKSTIDNKTDFIAWLDEGVVRIYVDLPPHLIEMIGKFYKGKVNG